MTDRLMLDDPLADLFDSGLAPEVRPAPPAHFVPVLERAFVENCKKCGGSGRFCGYSGRDFGPCFACKGKGKLTFKNSPAKRAEVRGKLAARKEAARLDNAEAFKAEHPAEWEWLVANSKREFAVSLMAGLMKYGHLTEGQMTAVRNGIIRAEEWARAREARVTEAPTVNVTKIENAFAVAREKANRPGAMGVMVKPLRLKSGDVSMLWTPGSLGSKWEGMLFAKTEDGKKLGWIKDGKFTARYECTPVEKAAVIDCAENPETAAIAYGKAWSRCGVCGRSLLNDVSIARGIGPICAEKFGW